MFLEHQLEAETEFQSLERQPDLGCRDVADPQWGAAAHRLAEFRDSISKASISGQLLMGRPQSLCDQTFVF